MSNISRPHDLEIGDTITFGKLPQRDLDRQSFRVTDVNSYIFGRNPYAEFSLRGSNGVELTMSIEVEDDEEYLTFSKELSDADLEALFDVDEYEALFDEGPGYKLRRRGLPRGFDGWAADEYELDIFEAPATFMEGDFRNNSTGVKEEFEYYLLLDQSGEYAIEIEDYGDDDEELALTVYHDMDAIKSMTR